MKSVKSNNSNLGNAKKEKNDEFYTQLSDIENELRHYKEQFKDKIVYCNCDDPEWSNFWIYFSRNFEHLGLKKLISTHYEKDKPSFKLEIQRDINSDNKINHMDTIKTDLKQNGDFRSDECIELLKEADIIVSNPPFSLFREYVEQLEEYNKKYLIVGSMNAITYKDIFKHILEGNIWLGNTEVKKFIKPNGEIEKFGNICWFTNLNHNKRNEKLILWKEFNSDIHKFYDDYKILNIDKVSDIPLGYTDLMAVPISYLNKHNPNQFEILGIANSARYIGVECKTLINGRKIYNRIIIKLNTNNKESI